MIDYKNVYRDIAPKEAILNGAAAYGRARVGGAGALTLDVLKEGALEVCRSHAVEKLRPGIDTLLQGAVAGFQILHGERPKPTTYPDTDAGRYDAAMWENRVAAPWRDQFDDWMIAQIGADLARAIGPSCMGEHFTDTDIDDETVRRKVTVEVCERLAESAMPMDFPNDPARAKPSMNKTLSAAGIVDSDFAPYLAGIVPATQPEQSEENMIDEPSARARVEAVVGKFAIGQGADFDPLLLGELLHVAFDDDEFISLGAIERLGGAKEDAPYFQAWIQHAPLEAVATAIAAAFAAQSSGAVVEPPKKTGKRAPKIVAPPVPGETPPAPPAAAPAAPPSPHGDYSDVVKLWREFGKDSDDTIGKALGVSRATISNIGAGKVKCPLSPEQAAHVRTALTAKIDGLSKALALLE